MKPRTKKKPRVVAFPGFPEEIGRDRITFPDAMEILREPILAFAPADWVRRHGSPFQKEILDAAPLAHRSRYVLVSTQVRVVTPSLLIHPVEFPELASRRNEWHVDNFGEDAARVHAICNTLGTEFNTRPVELVVPPDADLSYRWFCWVLTKNARALGLRGKMAPRARFVTFSRHIHRAPQPTKTELRYFLRIMETNTLENRTGQYVVRKSYLYDGETPVENVVQHDDGSVTVRYGRSG